MKWGRNEQEADREESILALYTPEPQKGILHDPCHQAETAGGMLAALIPFHCLAQALKPWQGSF